MSPSVYGCAGRRNSSRIGACSTMRPAYMTAASSAISAATPRSCVTKMTARPLRSTSPLTCARAAGCKPRSARRVTLLPDPDSPRSASTRPASSEKLTPLTARTSPSRVSNVTLRSRTVRSAMRVAAMITPRAQAPATSTASAPGHLLRPPLDGAEACVAEEVVGQGERLHRLVAIAAARHARVARRHDVVQAQRVRTEDTHGEADGASIDALVAELVRVRRRPLADADDPILPPARLEHREVADDEAQAEQRFGNDTVSEVALRVASRGAGRTEADAEQRRALQRHRPRQPPLANRPEREVGRRDVEDLWREVFVAAEQSPHAAIVVADGVLVADEQTADREVFDRVGSGPRVRHGGELEQKEVEWALVGVPGLARQPVRHVEVQAAVLLLHVGRQMRVGHARGERDAGAEADVHGRVVARKHRLEAIAEDEAIEAQTRRQHRSPQLAPESWRPATPPAQQAGESACRLPTKAA